MSDVEVFVDPMSMFIDDNENHYICCQIPPGTLSIDVALCGKVVIGEVDPFIDDEPVSCTECERLNDIPGCPLGYKCPQEED